MEVTRTFTHRTYGNIGSVELVAPKGKWTLDGKELPEQSVDHLLHFALQTLQDAYAGSKTADEAKGAFDGKYDKLVNGTIGTRGGGEGATLETIVARSIMKVAAMAGLSEADRKTFDEMDASAQNAKLDEWLVDNQPALQSAIDDEVAERKAKAARKAALKGSVKVKL